MWIKTIAGNFQRQQQQQQRRLQRICNWIELDGRGLGEGSWGWGLSELKRQISAHAECRTRAYRGREREREPSLKHCVDFTTGRLEPNIAIVKHTDMPGTHTHTHYNTQPHTHRRRRQRDMLRGPADNAQYVYAQFSGHSQNVVPNGECRGEYPVKTGSLKSG